MSEVCGVGSHRGRCIEEPLDLFRRKFSLEEGSPDVVLAEGVLIGDIDHPLMAMTLPAHEDDPVRLPYIGPSGLAQPTDDLIAWYPKEFTHGRRGPQGDLSAQ